MPIGWCWSTRWGQLSFQSQHFSQKCCMSPSHQAPIDLIGMYRQKPNSRISSAVETQIFIRGTRSKVCSASHPIDVASGGLNGHPSWVH